MVARFEAERQALALMDHPNIAQVFDGGVTDSGRPYFVMELVKGVPITAFCDKNNSPTEERLRLFVDVCRAVQHAHQKGVIHRDLKPSNIMVTLHDGVPVAKVIDFGVAKALSQRLTEKTLFTAYGQMIGTPLYMSPEQAEMSGLDVDTRSDIYSLGVLLYELLTGCTPLEAAALRDAGYAEMQRIIRETEPPRPSVRLSTSGQRLTEIAQHRSIDPKGLRRLVAGELDWIVMKALEKDRRRRYETATAFAADVERFLRQEPVEAGPPTAAYRLRKFVARRKALFATATAVAVTLVLGFIGTTTGWISANRGWISASRARDDALQEKQRADAERARAEQVAKEKEAARANLDQTHRKLQQTAYSLGMIAAFQAWQTANPLGARELLLESGAGGRQIAPPDLAWRFLWQRCREAFPETLDVGGETRCMTYSPDGTCLAVSLTTGAVLLHDFGKNQNTILDLPKEASETWGIVECLRFTHDQKYLAAGGALQDSSGFVCLWEISTGRPTLLPLKHTGRVLSVAFSPDSSLGASGSAKEVGFDATQEVCTYKVWDMPSGAERREWTTSFHDHPQVAFPGPMSGLLAGSTGDHVQFWSIDSGKTMLSTEANSGTAFSVSPDGRSLVTAGGEGVRLWDLTSTAAVKRDKLTWRRCDAVAFSPDGTLVAARDRDSSEVRVWLRESRQQLVQLGGGYESPGVFGSSSLAFSPDSKRVALGRDCVKVWDVHRWKANSFCGFGDVFAVLPSDDGGSLTVADGIGTTRIELSTGARSGMLGKFSACSPDGSRVVTLADDGSMRVLDVQSGKQLMVFDDEACPPVSLSAGGRTVVASGRDAVLRQYDLFSQTSTVVGGYSGRVRDDFVSVPHTPRALALAPDASRLVVAINAAERKVNVEVWRLPSRTRHSLGSYDKRWVGACFSSRGKYLVVTPMWEGSSGDTVQVWDVQGPTPVRLAEFRSPSRVHRVKFAPNDAVFAISGRAPGELVIYDIHKNSIVRPAASSRRGYVAWRSLRTGEVS